MKQLYIFKGKVHSGKTTQLQKWLLQNNNVTGILSPVLNGKRFILNINTNEMKLLEVENELQDEAVLETGNYKFKESVFNWGCNVLLDAIRENPEWIVIDEFGPLELKEKALFPAVKEIITNENVLKNTNVLIVIRESLVGKFIAHFDLDESQIKYFSISKS